MHAIRSVKAMTIQAQLPEPVVFGEWIMRHREFVLVEVLTESGVAGYSYTLSRDGAVAEQIRRTIASIYLGTEVGECEMTFQIAWRRSLASHAAGIGLRALSIVDLACWDAAARAAGKSIAAFLGGRNHPMLATAIIGYPPAAMGPEETGAQAADLYAKGWRRFKAPIAATPERTASRLVAARAAAPDGWLGLDAAWVFDDATAAAELVNSFDVGLGWFEDVFPPGEVSQLLRLKELTAIPIAMGDEQGGSYYPDALISAKAADVIRVDLTCMGGLTRGRPLISKILAAGLQFAPHMFPHIHGQVLSGLGYTDAPIEWGVPFTGVHPMDDTLEHPPLMGDGRMAALPEELGFGVLVDRQWIRSQPHDDPDGILIDS